MPPSTNGLFATVTIKGKPRRIITREYKAWRAIAKAAVEKAWIDQGRPSFERHMQLTIHIGLNYIGDISNRIKAIEDSLSEAIPGLPDDRYYDRVEIERVPGMIGARVMVMQLAPPEKRAA
jgi:hypothetical protein